MNRRKLFKFLGIGVAASLVAPKILADENKLPIVPIDWGTVLKKLPPEPSIESLIREEHRILVDILQRMNMKQLELNEIPNVAKINIP